MSERLQRKEDIDRLVLLIEELEPFLDSSGRGYCRMPHAEKEKRGVLSLRSPQVWSLLAYRFHKEHKEHPGRERISQAIQFIEGRLLQHRHGPVSQKECPILRCFLRAVDEHESGSGSAHDILKMLRETQVQCRILQGAEKLPKNATAMGKWLTRNQLLLEAHGLEICRPPRGSKKRLWDWRKIIRDDDACDTSNGNVSPGASLSNSKESKENQRDDALTDDELEDLLPKEALS